LQRLAQRGTLFRSHLRTHARMRFVHGAVGSALRSTQHMFAVDPYLGRGVPQSGANADRATGIGGDGDGHDCRGGEARYDSQT
jgi:hypothetical protein